MDDVVVLASTQDHLLATDVYAGGDEGDGGARGLVHYGGSAGGE